MHMVARLDDFDGFSSCNGLILFLHIVYKLYLVTFKVGGSMSATDQKHGNKRGIVIFGIDYFAFVGKVNVLSSVALEW